MYIVLNQIVRIGIYIAQFTMDIGFSSDFVMALTMTYKIVLFFVYMYNMGILNRYNYLKNKELEEERACE